MISSRIGGNRLIIGNAYMDLANAIQTRSMGEDTLTSALNTQFEALKIRFNKEISAGLLGRPASEALPTESRAQSAFRSRVSLLLEYCVIELLAEFVDRDTQGSARVTFNILNEFADFFIRDDQWQRNLRIDVKTMHIESLEASARYDTRAEEIRADDDYLLFLTWKWEKSVLKEVELYYPTIIDGVFIRAVNVAEERDRRQILAGGSFDDDGYALAESGNRDTNFGKIKRLVHASRRDSPDLDSGLQKLLDIIVNQPTLSAEPEPLKRIFSVTDESESGDISSDTESS